LDALRSKETFDNVIFTDETSVEKVADGGLFFYKRTSDCLVKKRVRQRWIQIFPKGGPGMDFENKIRG
jgi:hypothetical protein